MQDPGRTAHTASLAGVFHPQRRPLLIALACAVLSLFLSLVPRALAQQPGAQPEAPQGPDVQIVIISEGTGPDHVAVSYNTDPPKEQVQQDFAALAKELGVPPPKVSVTREAGITAGEARLPGLIRPSSGPVNLDPLIQTYRRFGFFRVTALIMGQYAAPAPGNVSRPGLRVETRVGQNTVDHLVWVDQSEGVPDRVASVTETGPDWRMIALLVFIAAVVALSVFLVVYVVLGQRRAAAARGGES